MATALHLESADFAAIIFQRPIAIDIDLRLLPTIVPCLDPLPSPLQCRPPYQTVFSLSSCVFVSCEERQRLQYLRFVDSSRSPLIHSPRYRLWLISSSSPPPAPPARASIRYPRPSLDSTCQQPCPYRAKPTDPFLSNAVSRRGALSARTQQHALVVSHTYQAQARNRLCLAAHEWPGRSQSQLTFASCDKALTAYYNHGVPVNCRRPRAELSLLHTISIPL